MATLYTNMLSKMLTLVFGKNLTLYTNMFSKMLTLTTGQNVGLYMKNFEHVEYNVDSELWAKC